MQLTFDLMSYVLILSSICILTSRAAILSSKPHKNSVLSDFSTKSNKAVMDEDNLCDGEVGTIPHSTDCTRFYTCIDIAGVIWIESSQCAMGSFFDPKSGVCIDGSCPTPPPTTTTPAPPRQLKCPPTGGGTNAGFGFNKWSRLIMHPDDCTRFYSCHRFSSKWFTFTFSCAPNHIFSPLAGICVTGQSDTCSPTGAYYNLMLNSPDN